MNNSEIATAPPRRVGALQITTRVLGLVLIATTLYLCGCADRTREAVDRDLPPETVEFRPVLDEGGIEMALEGTDELLRLGGPLLDLSDVDRVGIGDNGYGPSLVLEFTEAGSAKLTTVTGDLTGERLAIILQGKLVMAPNVNEAITGGSVEISGTFTRAELEAIVAALNDPRE